MSDNGLVADIDYFPVTVGALREALKNVPDDVVVLMSLDDGGRDVRVLDGIIVNAAVNWKTGGIGLLWLDEGLMVDGFSSKDVVPDGDASPVVILMPLVLGEDEDE